jgi:hypothetical protein
MVNVVVRSFPISAKPSVDRLRGGAERRDWDRYGDRTS